jgi:hypothetical protein
MRMGAKRRRRRKATAEVIQGEAGSNRADGEQAPINQAAIDLLQLWLDADGEEVRDQQDTFAALRQGIDEERARLGMRRLFS